jgi:ribonuclease-3
VHGYGTTADAVVQAFLPEIERALENPVDFKSALQEFLARRGQTVVYEVTEAVIGACYLNVGYERTAEAVVEAFQPELAEALEHPVDFKSTLQERLARGGHVVEYDVTAELGPPHDRIFEVRASVGGKAVGEGSGRSKKAAEQAAARAALEALTDEDGV